MAFHAAPPQGEWLNDPNGLVQTAQGWVLFAQHRADAPDFAAANWARFTSPDLLDWRCDGAVIRHEGDAQAYSGSVVAGDGGLDAFLTIHANGDEYQERRRSVDAGLTWAPAPLSLPASARGANVRDPFVFGCDGDWRMLLACPCPWTGWETAPPSMIKVFRSADKAVWREAGSIGPWHPPGVMWEVPVLLRQPCGDVLLISCVDRRGGADCSVWAWAGAVTEAGFAAATGWPAKGQRVDLGPDFYAAIPAAGAAPGAPLIGWLGSWATARSMAWPGFAGGPISLPRQLILDNGRLAHRPFPALAARFAEAGDDVPVAGLVTAEFDGHRDFRIRVRASGIEACIAGDLTTGALTVSRIGAGIDWHRVHRGVLIAATRRRAEIFVDGPAFEIFLDPDGAAISMALPVSGGFTVTVESGGHPVPLLWKCLPAAGGAGDGM